MGRFILIRVESTSTADKLLERFAAVPAIKVVGLFVSPRTFCECGPRKGSSTRDRSRPMIRSRKWGTMHCPDCKKPSSAVSHQLRNLLLPEGLHPRWHDAFLTVHEPFDGDPIAKYGPDIMDISYDTLKRGREVMRRHRRKKARNGG